MERYELKIEDIDFEGLTGLSIVEYPAIEENFVKMSKEVKMADFNEEKRIISGPALIPNKDTLEKNSLGGIYARYISEETIREAVQLFFKYNNNNNITLQHMSKVGDVVLFESWIIEDPEKDKSNFYGFSLPKGTWFVSLKIYNDSIWDMVKMRMINGFSIEGWFTHKLVEQSKNEPNEKELLEDIIKLIDKMI